MKTKMTVHSRPLVVRAFVMSLLGLSLACQLLAAEKAGPERWQEAIAAFEAADKANPPRRVRSCSSARPRLSAGKRWPRIFPNTR